MATVAQQFVPEGAAYLSGAGTPEFKMIEGTNFTVSSLGFDASAIEAAYWKFRALAYGSGSLSLDIEWYADTASSGDVLWEGAIAAVTPDTDTQDVETKALATASTILDTHLGTTGQRLHRAALTISNLDSLAVNDIVWLRLRRMATDGTDTMTGDALVTLLTLSYSDT